MQVTAEMQADTGQSVTEAARRAQILTATIDALAELGYARTSFERLRERAALSSTRIITYHFGTRADLMKAVLGTIVYVKDQFTAARAADSTDRAVLLRAYIEADVAFLKQHPEAVRALEEVRRHGEHDAVTEALMTDLRYGRLERQLRQGQAEGAFGVFDPAVMARTVAHALDGAEAALAADPALDLEAYARELADLFTKATRP
ncbi:TetR family transcriptional regulator [Amycolatopsis sp. K13G38]|uniref:TetR family transcriptional regulator n=1 Tax=Amycolatopsis acididurans TaxID=2724524 RepID=A0ABX1J2N6_9PSEU|nr:TetR family transcriptional regulator [Amycolatopsis acididurans]NKQ52615.1 TetR family transcriptional regulator [Amycolatopsis acididurans]